MCAILIIGTGHASSHGNIQHRRPQYGHWDVERAGNQGEGGKFSLHSELGTRQFAERATLDMGYKVSEEARPGRTECVWVERGLVVSLRQRNIEESFLCCPAHL